MNNNMITLALFAYNQEEYIKEAILGAFSQSYSPLQIILSDDCSTDSTFDLMKELVSKYNGPHEVVLNRNKQNKGLIGHINHVFTEIVQTDIVVMAAGDDISLPDRVEKTSKIFRDNPKVTSVSMSYQNIDKNGEKIKTRTFSNKNSYTIHDYVNKDLAPLLGCTRAYSIKIFDVFGPLRSDCGVEDSTLVFRSLLLGNSVHFNEVGVYYRRLAVSMSTSLNISDYNGVMKQRVVDTTLAQKLSIINSKLEVEINGAVDKSSRKHKCLHNFIENNYNLWFFVLKIVFNSDFKNNEKLEYFKTYIKSISKPDAK